jgi:hypothetical protein
MSGVASAFRSSTDQVRAGAGNLVVLGRGRARNPDSTDTRAVNDQRHAATERHKGLPMPVIDGDFEDVSDDAKS